MTVGPDGRFWFTITDGTQRDGHVGATTTTGKFSFYDIGSSSSEEAIASGPDASLWVLLDTRPTASILEVDHNGKIVAGHPVSAPFAMVLGASRMALAPDDRVWLNDNRYLYAISSSGAQTTVYPPASSVQLCRPYGAQVVAGQKLSVLGRALDQATAVTVAGVSASFTFVSPVQIDVTIPATLPSGDTSLVVTGGTTSATLPGGVDVEGPPTITSVSPACGSPAGGNIIEVQGTELDATTSATVGGKPASIVIDHSHFPSETGVAISTPQHLLPGTVDVRVTTIAGTSAIVPADRFTYSPLCQ
jgi:hypothetical protein